MPWQREKQERAENIERGREIIDKELRRLNLSLSASAFADSAYRISRGGTRKRAEVARR